jgi:hypothetical protein
MKRLRLLTISALVALVALPSIASAHWEGRTFPANGVWWAVHYNLVAGYRNLEVFSSYGGNNAVPYRISVMRANGTVQCTSGLAYGAGVHYIFKCDGSPFSDGSRARILPMPWPGTPTVGYYIRESPGL